jgi:hypothetical protein
LPYLAAQLLTIALWQLRGLGQKRIIHWYTTGHFALGGGIASPRTDYSALNNALAAYLPVAIATIIAVVCLFVAALMTTAAMVDAIAQEQRLNKSRILTQLTVHWRRILLFSLRFLITVVAFVAGTVGLSYYLLFRLDRLGILSTLWFQAILILVGIGCTAWLVMPATIRLLGREVAVSAKTRGQGTIMAVLAVEAGGVIGHFLPMLESSMVLNSQWGIAALSVFNSVIANAPDALLFVAGTTRNRVFARKHKR